MDKRGESEAGGTHPRVEALDAINRARHARGQEESSEELVTRWARIVLETYAGGPKRRARHGVGRSISNRIAESKTRHAGGFVLVTDRLLLAVARENESSEAETQQPQGRWLRHNANQSVRDNGPSLPP